MPTKEGIKRIKQLRESQAKQTPLCKLEIVTLPPNKWLVTIDRDGIHTSHICENWHSVCAYMDYITISMENV